MLTFSILLSCVLLGVDAGHFDISDACHKLEDCDDIFPEIDFRNDNELAFVTPGLNSICSKQTELNSCISDRESACSDEDVHNYISEVQDIVDFICSTSGQKLIQHLADSECATNAEYQTRLDAVEETCLDNFKADTMSYSATAISVQPTDFCPFVTTLEDCVAKGTTELCGDEMTIFVSIIYEIQVARDVRRDFTCAVWMPQPLPLSDDIDTNDARVLKLFPTFSVCGKVIVILASLLVYAVGCYGSNGHIGF